MQDISIKAQNYKCFEDELVFESLKRVNVIIGKNNSGKSSIIDVIDMVTTGEYSFEQTSWRNNTRPKIIYTSTITNEIVNRVFPGNMFNGQIGVNINHNTYGRHYIGRQISWTRTGGGNRASELINCQDHGINPSLKTLTDPDYHRSLPSNMPIILEGKVFKRIAAERDIMPESDNETMYPIMPNGNGLTNAIQSFLNHAHLPSSLIKKDFLGALNEIFAHDSEFTDIVCQLHKPSKMWEIFLEEKHKGQIALSKSGSGLKTVITVLASLLLIPSMEEKKLNSYVFGFEELENNIHPALLRRLNDYLYRASIEHDFMYFLTTHSSVLIDQFSKQNDAQIIHVTQSDGKATCRTTKTYIENNGILDDLDVRASDLLQANGIIWVEGPSDRIYINRWIELWSGGELREGTHYQCISYGGRLLSHLSADLPELVNESVSILNTNRNAIMLIDSDMKHEDTSINDTKKRIVKEFEEIGSLAWVTKGKEIENYIPKDIVNSFWTIEDSPQVEQYSSFFEHLDDLSDKEGTRYSAKKPLLAEKLVGLMTKENLSPILDLDKQMNEVCKSIRRWNS